MWVCPPSSASYKQCVHALEFPHPLTTRSGKAGWTTEDNATHPPLRRHSSFVDKLWAHWRGALQPGLWKIPRKPQVAFCGATRRASSSYSAEPICVFLALLSGLPKSSQDSLPLVMEFLVRPLTSCPPPHVDVAGGVNTGSFLYCEQKCEHKQLHCPYLLPSLPLNELGEHWATSWDLAQPPLQSCQVLKVCLVPPGTEGHMIWEFSLS